MFSALATYLLVERLTGSSRAAFLSALIYGFYPYRFEHYSHLELQMTHWMPLALIWLHRFSATLKVRDAVAVAVLAAAQLYSSMYYGVFFALYAGAVLGTLLVVARPPWRRLLVPVASALLVAIALAVPLARPYLAAQAVKGDRDEGAIRVYSAGPSDYLRAHPRSATYGGRLLADRYPERALFPGTLPLALSAVALVPPVGAIRLAYAAGLVAAFDMSLGFNGVTYKHLYRWLLPDPRPSRPGAHEHRPGDQPCRAGGVRRAAALAALPDSPAGEPSSSPRSCWRSRVTSGRRSSCTACGGSRRRSTPRSRDSRSSWRSFRPTSTFRSSPTRVPFMYFSIWHGLPMINGYSGFTPPDYEAADGGPARLSGAGDD